MSGKKISIEKYAGCFSETECLSCVFSYLNFKLKMQQYFIVVLKDLYCKKIKYFNKLFENKYKMWNYINGKCNRLNFLRFVNGWCISTSQWSIWNVLRSESSVAIIFGDFFFFFWNLINRTLKSIMIVES